MTKQSSRGGIGSHKHGISGLAPRSPRFKHLTQIEANKAAAAIKQKPPLPFNTITEAFSKKKQ